MNSGFSAPLLPLIFLSYAGRVCCRTQQACLLKKKTNWLSCIVGLQLVTDTQCLPFPVQFGTSQFTSVWENAESPRREIAFPLAQDTDGWPLQVVIWKAGGGDVGIIYSTKCSWLCFHIARFVSCDNVSSFLACQSELRSYIRTGNN